MSNGLPTGGLSGLVRVGMLVTTERCCSGDNDDDRVLLVSLEMWAPLTAVWDPLVWELWCLCLCLCLRPSEVWALLREQATSVCSPVLTVLPVDKATVWSAISALENSVASIRWFACSCLDDLLAVTCTSTSSDLSLFFFLWSWWLPVASSRPFETVGCELAALVLLHVVLDGSESGRSCFHFLTRALALSPTSPSHFLRLLTSLPMWVTYTKTSEALFPSHMDRTVMELYTDCREPLEEWMGWQDFFQTYTMDHKAGQ